MLTRWEPVQGRGPQAGGQWTVTGNNTRWGNGWGGVCLWTLACQLLKTPRKMTRHKVLSSLEKHLSELSSHLGQQNRPRSPRRQGTCVFVRRGDASRSPCPDRFGHGVNVYFGAKESESRAAEWPMWGYMAGRAESLDAQPGLGFPSDSSLCLLSPGMRKEHWCPLPVVPAGALPMQCHVGATTSA